MARLRDSGRRLRLETYPFSFEMRTTIADIDQMRHLNNVAIAAFFQEGRVSLERAAFAEEGDAPDPSLRRVIGKVEIEYLAEGTYPGMVTIAAGVSRFGVSSYGIGAALFQNGRCLALCESITVHVADGAAAPMPPRLRAPLERFAMNLDGPG